MSKANQKIECLKRLQDTTTGMDEMLAFLLSEALIKQEDVKLVRSASYPAKDMYKLLVTLAQSKLQLIEYEWVILPVEVIKITIVTDNQKREFEFTNF